MFSIELIQNQDQNQFYVDSLAATKGWHEGSLRATSVNVPRLWWQGETTQPTGGQGRAARVLVSGMGFGVGFLHT